MKATKKTVQPASVESQALVRLGDKANAEHQAAMHQGEETLKHAIECGRLLTEAKAQMKHGEWLPWLEAHFEASSQWAQGYMRLYNCRNLLTNANRGLDLSIKGGLKLLAEAKRIEKRAAVTTSGTPQAPTGKYRVLYADPPWEYSDSGLTEYGHAKSHYPTMPLADLCAMPAQEWAEDDAVLFLWTTSPMLEDAFQVIRAWGFKYKTSFVWDKVKHNFGHYNSVRHEFLLICTRGSCTPDDSRLFDSVQTIERPAQHSEKPEEFRKIIETLYTHGAKLELFARTQHKGWSVFGNQFDATTD